MKETKILCDNCSEDLTYTTNCVDYRLCLYNESMDVNSNIVTLAMRYPQLNRAYHFCRMDCLKKWVNRDSQRVCEENFAYHMGFNKDRC